jgi:hypothetical protein
MLKRIKVFNLRASHGSITVQPAVDLLGRRYREEKPGAGRVIGRESKYGYQ